MKYKLICIDMDGTLLDNNHEVSADNIKALKKASELGINIAITTGRIYASAKYYSNLIGINAHIITANGASIVDNINGDTVYTNTIPSDILSGVANIVAKYNLKINFTTSDTIFTAYEVPETHLYKIMNKSVSDDLKVKFITFDNIHKGISKFDGNVLKCIIIEDTDIESLKLARAEITESFGDFLHIVSSGPNNVEIMQKESSKGNAAKKLSEKFGLTKDEVMCIGDSENDLSMIQFAGLGVAMDNSMDILKSDANYITKSNNESGVAFAIEKFCF
ncbi:MAG: Cof-type HAD-IIB family hydrolase [Clostridium sp.]